MHRGGRTSPCGPGFRSPTWTRPKPCGMISLEVVRLLSRRMGNRVVSIRDSHLVANTHPELYPKMVWGGPEDLPLVISDAPEILDSGLAQGDGATLYIDQSDRITGARVLMFHQNQAKTALQVGLSVKSARSDGRLAIAGRSQAALDTNGTRAGHTVASKFFDAYDTRSREIQVRADVPILVDRWTVGPGQTLVVWYDLTLTDGEGAAAPLQVQTFATARRNLDPQTAWNLPLAPWQTEGNRSSKIRATVPHSFARVTVRVPRAASQGWFIDLASMSPSGGEGNSPGNSPIPPAGFPLRGKAGPWLAPALPLAETHGGTWDYQADPAGFDGANPATEYVPGWDWADRQAEGDPDPASPSLWYESKRYGAWMRQWNYGEYGCLIEWDIASEDGTPLRIATTPAREKFSIPWAWIKRSGEAGAKGRTQSDHIPWETITGGRLYNHPQAGESTAFILEDHASAQRILTTVTAGAYAPFRLVVDPVR